MISAKSITLDCRGFNITGQGGLSTHGINVSANYTKIKNCSVSKFSYGILFYSSNNILSNTKSHHNAEGIYLTYSNNNTLSNINSYSNYRGVYLYYSNNNTLSNISSYSNSNDGVYLYYSNNNTLSNISSYSNSGDGLNFASSHKNTLKRASSYNNSDAGVYIASSYNNAMRNVSMWGNKYNFDPSSTPDVSNDIDQSNRADGKPIYYLKNAKNMVFDSSTNSDSFYCFSCRNITLKGLNFTKNRFGIYFFNTSNSRIESINSYNNIRDGIYLSYSNNNTLSNINSYSNYRGIYFYVSNNNNTLSNISCYYNNYHGISFQSSDNNVLSNINSYSNSNNGINFDVSDNNVLSNINSYSNNGVGLNFLWSPNKLTRVNSYNNTGTGRGIVSSIVSSTSNFTLSNINSYNNRWSGILIDGPNHIMRNVSMWGNKYNFDPSFPPSPYNDIDQSNRAEGKPIYYIKNAKNMVFDSSTNAASFYCFSCNNITLKDLSFTKDGIGAYFFNTSNSRIEDISSYENNDYGVYFSDSTNNTISNIMSYSNGQYGPYFDGLTSSIILNFTSYNEFYGISFIYSDNNLLSNINSHGHSSDGIRFISSDNNILSNVISYNNSPYNGALSFWSSSNNTLLNILCYHNARALMFESSSQDNKIRYSSIYNNSIYNLYSQQADEVDARYNYWGFRKSEDIDAKIYDDNENPSYGAVSFQPWLNNPGTTFDEEFSEKLELYENISYQNFSLENVNVSGDLQGMLNFSEFDIVRITSGAFAGKGFSKGHWTALLSNNSYEGDWQGFLLHNQEDRKIYLKGSVVGYFKGIVYGYLMESVNGSNVYDIYKATWEITKNNMSAVLELNGSLNYKGFSDFQFVKMVMMQSSMKGYLTGDYNSNVGIVLTHLSVWDEPNPFYGEGFSIISFSSDAGSGQGWAYSSYSALLGAAELSGMFTSPFYGVGYGILDNSKTPARLIMEIERVDIGLPPMADLNTKMWGPAGISPGQTVHYIIELRNDGLKKAENVTVFMKLPYESQYISNTGGGAYNGVSHEVAWQLGDVFTRTQMFFTVTVRFVWGLPVGTTIKPIVYMPRDEVEVQVNPNSSISDKVVNATGDYVNCISNISNQSESALLYSELFIAEVAEKTNVTFNYTENETNITIIFNYTIQGNSWDEVHGTIGGYSKAGIDIAKTTKDAYDTSVAVKKEENFLNWLLNNNLISQADHDDYSKWYTEKSWTGFFASKFTKYVPIFGSLYSMATEAAFRGMDPIYRGKLWKTILIHTSFNPPAGSIEELYESYLNQNSFDTSSYTSRIVVARDPNIKYGPEGNVSPGQKLNYTVEYENEGEGIAFGVYFTDTLDNNLDDSTLEVGPVLSTVNHSVIAEPGIYNPKTRTITWFAGEVWPGEGGYASLNASVKWNANASARIINYAIVYFPSVPEETKTNGIISIVYVSPFFNITLTEGWNLVSFPLNLTNKTISSVFNGINFSSIFSYNSSWAYYFNEADKNLDKIGGKEGLWVKSLANQTLALEGKTYSYPVVTALSKGWNLIGYPSLQEKDITLALSSINGCYRNVFGYSGSWHGFNPLRQFELNSLKNMVPGYGYWIDVNCSYADWILD